MISKMDDLIFDRIYTDVLDTENGIYNEKGMYTPQDINRVMKNITTLYNRLTENGYRFSETIIIASGDWNISYYQGINTRLVIYNDTINAFRNKIGIFKDLPKLELNGIITLNFEQANLIEEILFYLYETIDNIELKKIYSGTIQSGNNILLPQYPLNIQSKRNTFKWLDNKKLIWKDIDRKALNWFEFEFKDW